VVKSLILNAGDTGKGKAYKFFRRPYNGHNFLNHRFSSVHSDLYWFIGAVGRVAVKILLQFLGTVETYAAAALAKAERR